MLGVTESDGGDCTIFELWPVISVVELEVVGKRGGRGPVPRNGEGNLEPGGVGNLLVAGYL